MMQVWISLTVLLYALVAVDQWRNLHQPSVVTRRCVSIVLSGAVIVAHAWLLHQWIDIAGGQNLDIFNMASLVIWMVAALVWLLTLFQPLGPLWLLVVPVAIISIVLRWVFPGLYVTQTKAEPEVITHILLAVLLVGVVCVAGLQALVVRWQQSLLKHKKECVWFNRLPAVETMQRLLYILLWVGFVLLSVVLFTSVISYGSLMLTNAAVLHKALWVALTWLVFAIMLLGHHAFAWQGRRAAIGTLVAMLLLVIIYLTSQILQV